MYAMPPQGSGVLTAYIMNILDGHFVDAQKTGFVDATLRSTTGFPRLSNRPTLGGLSWSK